MPPFIRDLITRGISNSFSCWSDAGVFILRLGSLFNETGAARGGVRNRAVTQEIFVYCGREGSELEGWFNSFTRAGCGVPLFSCARGDRFLANICELLRVTGRAPLGRKPPDNILAARAEFPTSWENPRSWISRLIRVPFCRPPSIRTSSLIVM